MIVALAAIVGAVAFVMLWKELAAKQRPRKLSNVAGAAAVVLIAALVLLTATGRLHWLAAVAAGALPFLRWTLGLLAGPLLSGMFRSRLHGGGERQGSAAGAAPQSSSVATDELRMTLDHDSSDMDGEVLRGRFAGKRLSELDITALKTLYDELAAVDSRQLLGAYLDRRFPGWADAGARREAPAGDREMDAEQALAVLGLKTGATEQEIVDAHRRLMQKLHPDHGGTDYLAATLNLAKQVLMG